MKTLLSTALLLMLAGCQASSQPPAPADSAPEPQIHTYREVDGRALSAYVFVPARHGGRERTSAILLFHGGGWSAGSPEWTFAAAGRFAGLGMVAIPIEYRLSQGDVTPIEALSDVCAAFRWVRRHAGDLQIDPERVAGYGTSAGGHLVASTATVGCPPGDGDGFRSEPDALLLWSPALDLSRDGWFEKKLQGRARSAQYSPVEHIRPSTPPTSIVIGAEDALTPLSGARRYCDQLIEAGGICELNVYEGVGHLLTRNLANQEDDFDPDPKAVAAGIARHKRFLMEKGFISRPGARRPARDGAAHGWRRTSRSTPELS
jgi:acetyl esterase